MGVQGLARQLLHSFLHCGRAGVARVAVHGVACQRVAGFAHVHADLVCASRFQAAFDIAVRLIAFQHGHMGYGFFAAEFDHGHFQAVVRVAADERFDFAVKRDDAVCHSTVNPLHAAVLQLLHQVVLRGQRFGHHHQAAGVFVQAVHDAGARHLAQFGAVREQAVEQRARPVAGGGVNHQTGGFVQHNHAVVFIHDVQIHGFGFEGLVFVAGLNLHAQEFATDEFVFGAGGLAVALHQPVFNPRGDAAARIIGQQFGQCGVQPCAGQFVGHG